MSTSVLLAAVLTTGAPLPVVAHGAFGPMQYVPPGVTIVQGASPVVYIPPPMVVYPSGPQFVQGYAPPYPPPAIHMAPSFAPSGPPVGMSPAFGSGPMFAPPMGPPMMMGGGFGRACST